ncbi:MAG: hypothetical protein ABL929_05710 [Ferruginibacter sp.]|nr:hypothetical protein [Ferruginibacter sp.]
MAFTNAIANNNNDTVYTYYDAARNKYVLNENELEYIPVKVSESSSGKYTGGTYTTKAITEKESHELEQLFKTALANKKAQTNKNIKPNAAVEINYGNKQIDFLLKSTAAINISLKNFLTQLMKN